MASYLLKNGGFLTVVKGNSGYFIMNISRDGTVKRLKKLPIRESRENAEKDLEAYARAHGLVWIQQEIRT